MTFWRSGVSPTGARGRAWRGVVLERLTAMGPQPRRLRVPLRHAQLHPQPVVVKPRVPAPWRSEPLSRRELPTCRAELPTPQVDLGDAEPGTPLSVPETQGGRTFVGLVEHQQALVAGDAGPRRPAQDQAVRALRPRDRPSRLHRDGTVGSRARGGRTVALRAGRQPDAARPRSRHTRRSAREAPSWRFVEPQSGAIAPMRQR